MTQTKEKPIVIKGKLISIDKVFQWAEVLVGHKGYTISYYIDNREKVARLKVLSGIEKNPPYLAVTEMKDAALDHILHYCPELSKEGWIY
jgi:hypothetical protein